VAVPGTPALPSHADMQWWWDDIDLWSPRDALVIQAASLVLGVTTQMTLAQKLRPSKCGDRLDSNPKAPKALWQIAPVHDLCQVRNSNKSTCLNA
jgi:hypothetical protein